MTCIVGLEKNGVVYMGGDSAGVAGLSISVRKDEKVFINGPFIMGFTTSFRMGQLLRYKFVPPVQDAKNKDDVKFMTVDFIDAVRACFAENGFGSMGDKHDNIGGTFLVGYKGKLYSIDSDFQVGIKHCGYDAVGCGQDLALGAMFVNKSKKPKERILQALEAASTFSAGVAAPFYVLQSK